MGVCFSTTTTPPSPQPTAKVVTVSGDLLEFLSPIKASIVLPSSNSFLCDSDALLFDHRIPALKPEELLLPGHLYFVLPVQKQERKLTGEEMAEMAVRASSAMGRRNKRGKNGKVAPVAMFGDEDENDVIRVSASPVIVNKSLPRSRSVLGRFRRNSFKLGLTTIHE